MVPERDEDLELALSLHRELNGLTRRSRQPSRSNYESALQKLHSKKRRDDDRPSTTSSGSGSKRRSGGAGREEDDPHRLKKLKPPGTSSSDGSDLSNPSSGQQSSQQQQQQQDHHSSDRKAAGEHAVVHGPSLAAAAQARGKAAKAGASGGALGGGGSSQQQLVKCFFAGVRWGTLLPPGALKDRASLAAAVSKAFEQEGVRCSEASAHVVFVTTDQQTFEFPGRHQQTAGAQGEWDVAARRAARIYVQ